MGNEKACPECNAKIANRSEKLREENREEYNKYHSIRNQNVYNKRKESGVCTRCGKRKTDPGHSTCKMCREKFNENRRIRKGPHDRSERYEKGICFFCDNPIKQGYKVCEKHYQMNLKKLDNDKCRKATEEIKKIEHIRIKKQERGLENEGSSN